MIDWLQAFALTQLIEVPVYLAFGRAIPLPRRWLLAFGASAWTHPLVWWLVLCVPWPYPVLVVLAEGLAIGGETLWGRTFGLRTAFAASLTANLCSYLVGTLLRALTGWP